MDGLTTCMMHPETDGKSSPCDELEPIFALNAQFLDTLVLAAASPACKLPLALSLRGLLRRMRPEDRARLARGPLLLDAGFDDLLRWRQVQSGRLPPRHLAAQTIPWMPRAEAIRLARSTFMLAWYFSRTRPSAARVLLGIPTSCAQLIGALPLRTVQLLGERYEWVRPRWDAYPQFWRELLFLAMHPPKTLPWSAMLRAIELLEDWERSR